jgi:hypothetical protein
MKKADINANFRDARKTGGAIKADGWTFIATMAPNMPRGGPMAAWDYIYTLVNPSGTRHQLGKGQASATNFADRIINK